MKIMVTAILLILGFMGLGVGLFLQFLVLQKIQADSLMWFLFWFNIPVILIISVLKEAWAKVKE